MEANGHSEERSDERGSAKRVLQVSILRRADYFDSGSATATAGGNEFSAGRHESTKGSTARAYSCSTGTDRSEIARVEIARDERGQPSELLVGQECLDLWRQLPK